MPDVSLKSLYLQKITSLLTTMTISIANPIYDSVFKYLMEDERVAKTILSALLKKEVKSVKVRPHEYSNTTRDAISMFRIDFSANVVEADGSERVITIELQKTWLDTETLRFRQYLGLQYNSRANIRDDSKKGYAYPMVAVYLLGHRVGNINEPVVYVGHKVCDYDGREVGGVDSQFVESLTHDSIIVQIPLLRGRVNNRLEKVLSVFDQSRTSKQDKQVLKIDETDYSTDSEMMYVLHRLTAAADAEMRQDMNVEDEYYQAIEDRDTALLKREKQLRETEILLKEKSSQLEEKSSQLEEKNSQLEEKNSQLEEKNSQLEEKNSQLEEKNSQLEEKNSQLEEKDARINEQNLLLGNMAKALHGSGMSAEAIANATGLSVESITALLGATNA